MSVLDRFFTAAEERGKENNAFSSLPSNLVVEEGGEKFSLEDGHQLPISFYDEKKKEFFFITNLLSSRSLTT